MRRTECHRSIQAIAIALIILAMLSSVHGQTATGGSYSLDQCLVANGGGTSIDGINNLYKIEATSGQAAAGENMTGGPPVYAARNGFWAPQALPPTAANVSVGGRVITDHGLGIRNVRVMLAGGGLTAPRVALTSSFGYFRFDDIEAGHTYIITVAAKRFTFTNPTQAVSVLDTVADLSFIATVPD